MGWGTTKNESSANILSRKIKKKKAEYTKHNFLFHAKIMHDGKRKQEVIKQK